LSSNLSSIHHRYTVTHRNQTENQTLGILSGLIKPNYRTQILMWTREEEERRGGGRGVG